VSDELELLRAFRAEDGVVDAASAHAARTRLRTHIAGGADGAAAGRRGRPGKRGRVRLSWGAVAGCAAIAVMIAVGAVFLGLRGHPAPRHSTPSSHRHPQPLVLKNLAPARPSPLPGQLLCNADLAPPGVIPGLGGPRRGVIQVNAATIHGVNASPFFITAHGLTPSTRAREYAVWVTQESGTVNDAEPIPGAKPRLIGVITPGVGTDGRLSAEGVLPAGINGPYKVRITVQPHSATKPGPTVLEGLAQL
jgi:hypothetical protein